MIWWFEFFLLRHTQQKLTKHQLFLPRSFVDICRRNYTFQRWQVRKWTPSNSTLALHESNNNKNQGGMCSCQVPAQNVPSIVFSCRFVEAGGKFEMFECVTCFFWFVLHTFLLNDSLSVSVLKGGTSGSNPFQFVDPFFSWWVFFGDLLVLAGVATSGWKAGRL